MGPEAWATWQRCPSSGGGGALSLVPGRRLPGSGGSLAPSGGPVWVPVGNHLLQAPPRQTPPQGSPPEGPGRAGGSPSSLTPTQPAWPPAPPPPRGGPLSRPCPRPAPPPNLDGALSARAGPARSRPAAQGSGEAGGGRADPHGGGREQAGPRTTSGPPAGLSSGLGRGPRPPRKSVQLCRPGRGWEGAQGLAMARGVTAAITDRPLHLREMESGTSPPPEAQPARTPGSGRGGSGLGGCRRRVLKGRVGWRRFWALSRLTPCGSDR